MAAELKKKVVNPAKMKVQKEEPYVCFEPDEWYLLEFESATPGQGKFGPYMKLQFKVLNGLLENGDSAKGKTITRLVDATIAPNKPLFEFACIMSGAELAEGDDFDLTSYYGKKYRGLIQDRKPNKNSTDNKRYQQVSKIKKYVKKKDK